MYLQKAINRYKEATNNEKSTCCLIAGSKNSCQVCPNYKLRTNKITMKLIEQEIKSQHKLSKDWEYFSLWQEIVTISNELNNIGLSLIDQDIDIKKITIVLDRSKQAIARLEIQKKLTKEK
jgi:hypothetical protein